MNTRREQIDAVDAALDRDAQLRRVLAKMDEWLGNSDGLMIEDVVEWRNALAAAIGLPEWT